MTPSCLSSRRFFQRTVQWFALLVCAAGCLWTKTACGDDVAINSLLHYRTFGHGLSQDLPEEVTVTSEAGGSFFFNNILYNGGVGIDVTSPEVAGKSGSYYTVNFPGANHQVQIGSYTGATRDDGFNFNGPADYYLQYQTTDWQILDAAYAPDGTLISLAANFEWLTADGQRAMQGEVRYHSDYPLRSNVVFASDAFTASASASGLAVTVNRSGDASMATSVDYHTEDYAAQAGRDYTATQGTLTWEAGDGAPKTFTVPLLQRTSTGSRVFFVHLDGATTGALVTAAATITDDTQPPSASLPAPNGAVDTTYPVYLTNSSSATLNQVVPSTDGSAFIVGHFNSVNGQFVPGLVRLNPQGKVDSAFAAQLPQTFAAAKLVVQPDGKLIVTGGQTSVRGQTTALVRLNLDGSQDASYQAPTLHNGGILDLTLQPDGRLVVCGNFQEGNGLLRLNVDGSVDTTFVRPTTNFLYQYQFSLWQPDGKLLVCDEYGTVTRLNPDASVDASFQAAMLLSGGQSVNTVALQPDGKLLALTYYINTTLNRFNHDGTLDAGFLFDSRTINKNATITAVALQADGKVLVGLATLSSNFIPSGELVRLNPDGTLDTTFQTGSELPIAIATLAVNPDGTLFVTGGYFSSALGNEVHTIFARLAAYPGGVEPTVTMSANAAATVRSTGEPVTVTFTRNGDLSAPMMVQYQVKGKAMPGTDYPALSGHKKIKAGQSTATIRITPLTSGLGRGTLAARIILQATGAYGLGATSQLKVKIVDPLR